MPNKDPAQRRKNHAIYMRQYLKDPEHRRVHLRRVRSYKTKMANSFSTAVCSECPKHLTIRQTNSNKKVCSSKCHHERVRKNLIQGWLNGRVSGGKAHGQIKTVIRCWLIEQHGAKCSQCGWNAVHPITGRVPLNVDHIDGDSTNSKPDNLRLLCPNCHSLTPTFGYLNRGRGRTSRRARYHRQREQELRYLSNFPVPEVREDSNSTVISVKETH